MKAEHRKELETNALADRMGRLLETAKHKPERGTFFYVFFGLAVVVAAFLSYRWYRTGKAENSEAWFNYYMGDVKTVLETHQDKVQGRAIRFDYAWEQLWGGIRKLGADPKGAREGLVRARNEYDKLREECAGDPMLVPEAIYGLALIEETLALEDGKHIDGAIEYYDELVKKHPSSAYGQLAEKRLEILNDNTKRDEVNQVYKDLQNIIRLDRKN